LPWCSELTQEIQTGARKLLTYEAFSGRSLNRPAAPTALAGTTRVRSPGKRTFSASASHPEAVDDETDQEIFLVRQSASPACFATLFLDRSVRLDTSSVFGKALGVEVNKSEEVTTLCFHCAQQIRIVCFRISTRTSRLPS